MAKLNEADWEAFEEDVKLLVDTIQKLFDAEQVRHYVDERNNTLYIEIKGLEELEENEIAEIAEPAFDELDLDFDEILLLPLKN